MRLSGLIAPLALLALSAAPAAAQTDIGNLSPEERSAFRAEVRAYLLEHPEVLFEAIQILEQRRSEANRANDADLVSENSDDLFADGFSYVGGNPDGDVTLVEFIDYRCGYCKKAHSEVKQVLEQDGNIRYIVKEFPILGPDSVSAGRMALAALKLDPSKYAELNDQLMSYDGTLNEQAAYRIARDVGYDISALKEAANAPEIEEQVKQTYELADRLGIQGTPGFVIGDQLVRGYVPGEELLAAVEAARSELSN